MDTQPGMTPVAGYADGGVIGASRSNLGGSWAWCHVNAAGQRIRQEAGLLIPKGRVTTITNNYSEYVAMVRCMEALPKGWIGNLFTDSNITIGRLASGWATNGLPDLLVRRGQRALARLGGVNFHLLDGHPTREQLATGTGKRGHAVSEHNVWCDAECVRRMQQYMDQIARIAGPAVRG